MVHLRTAFPQGAGEVKLLEEGPFKIDRQLMANGDRRNRIKWDTRRSHPFVKDKIPFPGFHIRPKLFKDPVLIRNIVSWNSIDYAPRNGLHGLAVFTKERCPIHQPLACGILHTTLRSHHTLLDGPRSSVPPNPWPPSNDPPARPPPHRRTPRKARARSWGIVALTGAWMSFTQG